MKTFLRTIVGPLVIGFLLLVSFTPFASASASKSSSLLPTNSPLSGGLLMAQAIHSGKVQLSGTVSSVNPDKHKNRLPNVQASEGGQPVNEDPIAVNPANAMQLMTGGNDYNCGTIRGFYNSDDGGKTWRHHCSASSLSGGCGDPTVGYDLNGVAYAGGIDSSNGCSTGVIGVEITTDNGKTWKPAVTAVTAYFSGGLTDKDWLQVDDSPNSPHANCVYISVTQFDPSSNTIITVTHSCDGGKTWKTVAVDTKQNYPASIDQFSDVTIGKDGTVYTSWMRCSANSGNCTGTTATFYISKSTDGGNTWSAPVVMLTAKLAGGTCGFYGCLPNTSERVSDIPAIGVDNSSGTNAGHLYAVVYNNNGSFLQVEVVHSADGGATWSAPVNVAPPSDKHDQFMPWLTVSATGVVGVTWLDRRNDPSNLSYETFAATSVDGGVTFPKNVQIASKPSNPLHDGFNGGFMGDYTGNYWDGKILYASWPDSRNGTNMQDEVGGLKSKV